MGKETKKLIARKEKPNGKQLKTQPYYIKHSTLLYDEKQK